MTKKVRSRKVEVMKNQLKKIKQTSDQNVQAQSEIAKELQELVSWSVAILGEAIQCAYGRKVYNDIEKLRLKMKNLRGKTPNDVFKGLEVQLQTMRKHTDEQLHQICHSYSLMLELINRCETAYRSYRLESRENNIPEKKPHAIIFVLTAHPTEARSPELLGLFESIQKILIRAITEDKELCRDELFHSLLISLKVALARKAKPTVIDEANNIYGYILKDEILESLIKFSRAEVNVSFRSWVGGDKDGHPGVNEKTLEESLSQSRKRLVEYIEGKLKKAIHMASYVDEKDMINLSSKLELCLHQLHILKSIKVGDGARVSDFKVKIKKIIQSYKRVVKTNSPELHDIECLMWIFPALVVPLEIREDSSLVAQAAQHNKDMAITKMLFKLKDISEGLEAKWYVRGFVLSMVESSEDILNGYSLVKSVFKNYEIPVVPLFENEKALTSARKILSGVFENKKEIARTHKKMWGKRYEVMIGYSDSSKENGVFSSRVMISSALKSIEKILSEQGLTPVFFHGSGGSIERGGGSLKEQTAWWPESAVNIFKATVQGEMVARNFGSEHIFSSQIKVILNQLGSYKGKKTTNVKLLLKFSDLIKKSYSSKIKDENFMRVIEFATPYSFLHHLKIGSRPSKRPSGSIKNNLRAIPWILCWTQTRILFPTWWGVGTAWSKMSKIDKADMKTALETNPVLMSFVKALGFTLAKVELGVWELYLINSSIEKELRVKVFEEFKKELHATEKFFKEITGGKEHLWFRPWLQDSIDFRSPMIHPLNLCQLESLRRGDLNLLRSSVTGIACGMLTTG